MTETQRRFGLPVRLPYDGATARIVTPQLTRRQLPPPPSSTSCQLSDTETSDLSSPDDGDKTATVERKLPLPLPVKEELDRAVPAHRLLDNSAGKSKAELASRGGLANRQLPKRSGGLSNSSSVSIQQLIIANFFIKCVYVTCHKERDLRLQVKILQAELFGALGPFSRDRSHNNFMKIIILVNFSR